MNIRSTDLTSPFAVSGNGTHSGSSHSLFSGLKTATATPIFEIPERRSSANLSHIAVEGEEPFLQLTLRGFDGTYSGQRLDDILDELTILVLAHAEATGSDMTDLDGLLTDDDLFDALVPLSEAEMEEMYLGTFGDDNDPFCGCDCDECSLERVALNEDLR